MVIGLVSGLLLFLIRIPVMTLYDLSPEGMEMMNTFLIILSVVCVGMSYQMPTNNGIIRGGGNAMFVVKMDLVSIWMIVIPPVLCYGFCGEGFSGGGWCAASTQTRYLNACLPFWSPHYGNWIRKLTRE